MEIIDILREEPFKNAKVLAAQGYLTNPVTSVNVLEATDIETWGTKDQLILSSYFALQLLDQEELEDFFQKLANIQISGLIIKTDRLIKAVPEDFINLCEKYHIPLIIVPGDLKYEYIVQAVLQPIINENTSLLNSYYNYRKVINELFFQELTYDEILKTFQSLLHVDCQFEVIHSKFFYTTRDRSTPYEVIESKPLPNTKFVDHQYYSRSLRYANGSEQTILSVIVPNLENKPYLFSVFRNHLDVTQKDYMLIENIVEFLQTELLKNHAIKKSQFVRKNNQMLDLLFDSSGSNTQKEEIKKLLDIDRNPYYQGVLVSLYFDGNHNSDPFTSPLDLAKAFFKERVAYYAFLQKNDDLIFLVNLKDPKDRLQSDFITPLIEMYGEKHPSVVAQVGLSGLYKDDFESMNDTLQRLKKFMKLTNNHSTIVDYENLGFYKLFLDVHSTEELLEYLPKDIMEFYSENPELATTLEVFLDNNQNYVKTGEVLYIHPKTVRYRIEKITDVLDLDLKNHHQLLTTHVSLKVCSYVQLHP